MKRKTTKKKVARSSGTGKFVTKKFAKEHPDTTTEKTVGATIKGKSQITGDGCN